MRRCILTIVLFITLPGPYLRAQTALDRISRVGDVRLVVVGGRATVMDVAPAQMPDAVTRQYRLIPDRRILFAIADIARLLAKGPLADVRLTQGTAGWTIQYGADTVGVLPFHADYRQSSALLEQWANRRNARTALGRNPIPAGVQQQADRAYADVRAPLILAALGELDRQAGAGAPAVAHLTEAARLLTLLELQSLDAIGMSDELYGHVSALLAVARAAGATIPRDEALHAFLMGYAVDADALAKRLPANDAVRLYIGNDTAALRRAAGSNGAANLTQYLHLLRLASRGDADAWAAAAETHSFIRPASLALFKPALELGQFEADAYLPAVAVPAVLSVMSSVPAPTNSANPEMSVLQQFESGLRDRHATLTGPFLNALTFNAFMRAYMYSVLYIAALHRLDSQAAPWLARDVLRAVRNAPPGPATQFERWLQHVTKAEEGTGDLNTLLDDIDNMPLLGHGARMRSLRAAVGATDYASPEVVEAARRMAAQMDARPVQLHDLGRMAYAYLQDVLLTRDAYAQEIRLRGRESGSTAAWLAWLEGDANRAVQLIRTGPGMPSERAQVVRMLASDSLVTAQTAVALFDTLYAESGRSYGVAGELISWHRQRNDNESILRISTSWLETGRAITVFDTISARNAAANAHYQLGRYEAARIAVESVLPSNQATSMGLAALIYQKLDDARKADEFGKKVVERYPNSAWARGVYADILWQQGRPNEVAAVLHAPAHPIDAWGWRYDVAPRFGKLVKTASVDDAVRVITPLLATTDNQLLASVEYLAAAAHDNGRSDIAFAIESRIRTTSQTGRAQIALRAYRYLRSAQGDAKALAWLRTVDIGAPEMVAPVIYRERLWPLLWSLTSNPGSNEAGQLIWLLRAAADVAQDGKDPHHAELVAHFQAPQSGKYAAAGRYIYGHITLADLMRYATDEYARCELAYYAALRARLRHDSVDEIRWYRAAVETGAREMAEFLFATDALAQWKGHARYQLFRSK